MDSSVKEDASSLGNEYHTIACGDTKILFFVELVEGKDTPKEGPNSKPEFEDEMKSKVAALVVRMSRDIWGSGHVVILDSGFGYIPTVVELANKGLFATAFMKKNRDWPRGTKAEEAMNHMQGVK